MCKKIGEVEVVQLVKISLKYLCEAQTENPHENATRKTLLKQNEKITQKDLRLTIYDGERWERERERERWSKKGWIMQSCVWSMVLVILARVPNVVAAVAVAVDVCVMQNDLYVWMIQSLLTWRCCCCCCCCCCRVVDEIEPWPPFEFKTKTF